MAATPLGPNDPRRTVEPMLVNVPYNVWRTAYAQESGLRIRRFCVVLILNNSLGENNPPPREYYNVDAKTVKQAAMVARDIFSQKDYEFVIVEDPKSCTKTWFDREAIKELAEK